VPVVPPLAAGWRRDVTRSSEQDSGGEWLLRARAAGTEVVRLKMAAVTRGSFAVFRQLVRKRLKSVYNVCLLLFTCLFTSAAHADGMTSSPLLSVGPLA